MKLSDMTTKKLAKAMTRNTCTNAVICVQKILREYDDFEWDGMLYRCGGPGSYYHVSQIGAEFYEDNGPCQQHKFPTLHKCLIFDSENNDMFEILAGLTGKTFDDIVDNGSWVEDIDDSLPRLRQLGFDGAIIHGETGREVQGPPVEIIVL